MKRKPCRRVIHCCACGHEFRGDLDVRLSGDKPLGCTQCGSEDIFYKADEGWPCSECRREFDAAEWMLERVAGGEA